MSRIRIFLVLLLALSAGGGLAYGTYNYMQGAPTTKAAPIQTRPVIVAAADLSLGTELRSEDVRVVDWPVAAIPAGSFSQPADVIGRGLVASVVQNEPILTQKLADGEAGAGLPPVIPAGMRAMSVRVNEVIGVAGHVLPGTRVDVLATASPTDQREHITSKLVLPNVQVLAAGTKLEQEGEKGKPMQVSVVTLLVTPAESELLTLASTEGKIQLALRNPLDLSAPSTPGVQPAVLLGYQSSPRPLATAARSTTAPRPARATATEAPLPTVEVIRGDQRVMEVVKD
jgi:pilus assembly protein CpaB